MSDEEKTNYGSGNSTCHGYILEWRLKPESAPLADLLPRHLSQTSEDWEHGPYNIEQLGQLGDPAEKLIRPMIDKKYDWGKSEHGLVSHRVAVAILACLRTALPEKLLKHVEWRIVRVKLEKSHKLTRDDDDLDAEKRSDELKAIFAEYT